MGCLIDFDLLQSGFKVSLFLIYFFLKGRRAIRMRGGGLKDRPLRKSFFFFVFFILNKNILPKIVKIRFRLFNYKGG